MNGYLTNAREVRSGNQVNKHIKKYRDGKKYIMDYCYVWTEISMWLRPWEFRESTLNVVVTMIIWNLWCEVRNFHV